MMWTEVKHEDVEKGKICQTYPGKKKNTNPYTTGRGWELSEKQL